MRKSRIAAAISAACVSKAKWPVSRKRTAASGMSRLNALGAGRQEERIVPAPHREEWRLVGAEVPLKSRVERDVALVVAEQVQLDFIGAGTRQIEVVKRLTVGRNRRLVGHAMYVLPARCLWGEEGAERFPIGVRRLLPIGPDRIPALTQSLFIGVAILRDDRCDALRMLRGDPEACRRAIVENVHREAIQADDLGEAVDDAGDMIERVGEV